MLFLIRTAFWLMIIVLLLPTDEQQRSEVYGTAQYVPIDERHPLQGQSPYSASKIAADKMAEAYYCSFNLPVVTVRPFNTFGPRQSLVAFRVSTISDACRTTMP